MSFEELCKELEQAPTAERKRLIDAALKRLIPKLGDAGLDTNGTITLLSSFMIAAAYADGKIVDSEYNAIYPLVRELFGEYVDFDTAKIAIDEIAADIGELKVRIIGILNSLAQLNPATQMDVATLCLAVCAADGDVSAKEKAFLLEVLI